VVFSFSCPSLPPHLPSFPTRRSSDLPDSYFHRYADLDSEQSAKTAAGIWNEINKPNLLKNILPTRFRADLILEKGSHHFVKSVRSEEHTSELQSRENLVCRLLLEKKK